MIITAMELSTANLTRSTMGMLDSILQENRADKLCEWDWPAMTIAPYDFGCFVTVPAQYQINPSAEVPEDLHNILTYASRLGVNLIRFDKDAEADENLPTYDW